MATTLNYTIIPSWTSYELLTQSTSLVSAIRVLYTIFTSENTLNVLAALKHITTKWPAIRSDIEECHRECQARAVRRGSFENEGNRAECAELCLLIFRDLTACDTNDKLFSEVQATFEHQLGKQEKKVKKNNFCSIADSIQRLNDMFDWVISLDKIATRSIVSIAKHILLKRSYESKCVRTLRRILPFTCRAQVNSEDSIYRAVRTVRGFFKTHNDDDDERNILSGPNILSCTGLSGTLGRSPQGMATSEIHSQQKQSFVETTYKRKPNSNFSEPMTPTTI
jgi:hypothetical protein